MDSTELKEFLDLSIELVGESNNDRNIYDIAEVLRNEIRSRAGKKANRDTGTLIALFDTMYYQTIEKDPKYILKLFPVFHFLCCEGELDWNIIKEIEKTA